MNDAEYNGDLLNQLNLLRHSNFDEYMNLVYQTIMSFPEETIKLASERETQKKTISELLDHYKEKEEYEKCAVLLELLNKINGEERSISSDEQP